jgi:hypothetical protein
MKLSKITLFLTLSLLMGALLTAIPQAQAQSNVNITFAASGYTNYSGEVFTIGTNTYSTWNLPVTLSLTPGTTYTVTAVESISSWSSVDYAFSSWENGNGLTTNTGTFTVPDQATTVTAYYVSTTVQVEFRYSELTNLNSITVLTVDGVEYQYNSWDLKTRVFQMPIGSTHTVTASTPLTGWDGFTHYFSSWTNGNGLTTTTGTFTVPTSDVVVTVNYALTEPTTTYATSLTVLCNKDSADPGNDVTISGVLTSSSVGVAGKTITLTYYNGAEWLSIGSATTNPDGTYSYDWTIPAEIENGLYPLKADFAGDSTYLASTASTGTPGNGGNLTVLPEAWGSIVALLACFGGALVFFKLRSKNPASSKA